MTQLDLINWSRHQPYPIHPGYKAAGTSSDAAEAMRPRAPTLRDKVLAALRLQPMSADECAAHLGITQFSCRPRVSELLRLGLIKETGERHRNESGAEAHTYRIR